MSTDSPDEELEQANIQHNRLDCLIMAFPESPRFDSIGLLTIVWIALGVSHGAWLIDNSIFPTNYVIWGAITIAVIAGVLKHIT